LSALQLCSFESISDWTFTNRFKLFTFVETVTSLRTCASLNHQKKMKGEAQSADFSKAYSKPIASNICC